MATAMSATRMVLATEAKKSARRKRPGGAGGEDPIAKEEGRRAVRARTEDIAPKPKSSGTENHTSTTKGGSENGSSESFASMLQRFAKINLQSGETSRLERCFLCGAETELAAFPKHVFACVDKMRQNKEADHLASIAAAGVQVCTSGSRCPRRDYQHFMSEYHPPVNCPVCSGEFSLYNIDAHLNFCMVAGAIDSQPAGSIVRKAEQLGPQFVLKANGVVFQIDLMELTQTTPHSGHARAIRRFEGGCWKWRDETGLFIDYGSRENRIIEMHYEAVHAGSAASTRDPDTVGSGSTAVTAISAEPPAGARSPSPDGKSSASASTSDLDNKLSGRLNTRQMAACAAHIVQEKDKTARRQSVPLSRLLASFKALGLTKENLEKKLR